MTTMADLPRVLLENYLMLAAAVDNQNLGRMQDMLQYQQKVHQNLLDIVQHIEDAPAVAMTTAAREPDPQAQQQHTQAQDQTAGAGQQIARDLGSTHQAACYSSGQQHCTQQPGADQAAFFAQFQHQVQQQQQQQQQPLQSSRQLQQQSCSTQGLRQQPVLHRQPLQQQQQPLALLEQQEQQQQQHGALPAWVSNVNQPVMQFLQGLGLQEYEPLLQQQAVDMAALQLMEERHLRELGLPIGAVVKIKAALAAMC